MNGTKLKQGRLAANLTQVQAAARLGLSQPYLSQLESGRRAVTSGVAREAAHLFALPPTSLAPPPGPPRPGSADTLPSRLAALGYPGYGHLRKGRLANPAVVVLDALSARSLDGRVAEALPWVLEKYPELDWEWLLAPAKVRNLQNRLGFLVTVARKLAERRRNSRAAEKLESVEKELENARLAAETTLGRDTMPEAEREWLRKHRSPEARHWNVLAGLRLQDLPYAS
jgi:transcriptional regulator with XRE-family HTH domain